MAINSILTDNLGCHDEDLRSTGALFRHLERAGIQQDNVSRYTLLKCASIAISEDVHRGHLAIGDAPGLYAHIHDTVMEVDATLPSELVVQEIVTDSLQSSSEI